MSYDLVFWKQVPPRSEHPMATYHSLMEGGVPEVVTEFPVEAFLDQVRSLYPAARREPYGSTEWLVWESGDGEAAFQIEWSRFYLWVALRPLEQDRANQLVDVGASLGAPLFDPQTGERFDSWLD